MGSRKLFPNKKKCIMLSVVPYVPPLKWYHWIDHAVKSHSPTPKFVILQHFLEDGFARVV